MPRKVKVIDDKGVISEMEVETPEEHISSFTRIWLTAYKHGSLSLDSAVDAIMRCSVGLIDEIVKQYKQPMVEGEPQ